MSEVDLACKVAEACPDSSFNQVTFPPSVEDIASVVDGHSSVEASSDFEFFELVS